MTEPAAPKERKRPSEEEINEAKRLKQDIPEGMTKSQWKKALKQRRWEETKDQYRTYKREKKKASRERNREREKAEEARLGKEEYLRQKKTKYHAHQQIETGVKFIMDCEFDHLMNGKEIISMSNQITRCYSAKRHCKHKVDMQISSFNKSLKARFDSGVSQYKLWDKQLITFSENDTLEEILPEDRSKLFYLTADTDEVIETLEPGTTYIIGGIVDKNRHKNLCVNKAKELGIRVGRLPIDKYIEMNGRQVLATSHVYEICCKWFENEKDWAKAFNDVLPPRKLRKDENGEVVVEDDGEEKEGEKEGEENEEEKEREENEEEKDEEEEGEKKE